MRAVIYYTTAANDFIRNFYFSFTPRRSSLFWNRIARHERHDCDMSDMIASQAIHERHECDTSAIQATRARHKCYRDRETSSRSIFIFRKSFI